MCLEGINRNGSPTSGADHLCLVSQLLGKRASRLQDLQFLGDERLRRTRQLTAGVANCIDVAFEIKRRHILKGDMSPLVG